MRVSTRMNSVCKELELAGSIESSVAVAVAVAVVLVLKVAVFVVLAAVAAAAAHRCAQLRYACEHKDELGLKGAGTCARYRETCQ